MSKAEMWKTLGIGLMQWGAAHSDRELKREALKYERARNERLDALKAREVTAMEGKTAAETDRIAAEAIRLGLENEHMPEKLRAEIENLYAQGKYTEAQSRLADANVGRVTEETRGASIANDLDEQFGTAERALGVAGKAEEVTGLSLSNDQQRIKNRLLETYGEEQLQLELDALYWGNEKTSAEIKKGDRTLALEERKQAMDEFVAGLDYDEAEGTYTSNGQPLSSKTEKLPTAALQIAEKFLPGFEEEAFKDAMERAIVEGKITEGMSEEEQLKVIKSLMPSANELLFKSVDYAVQQMGRANYGAMQFQATQEGVPDATGGLLRSPYSQGGGFLE